MRIRLLLISTLLLAAHYQTRAQTNPPFFSTLSVRDGLPSNIISAVAQDNKGFIWIGTANGLCRFDGHKFITFKKSESHQSLPANEISSLLIVGDELWVGTWKGLCRINVLTFAMTRIDLGQNSIIRTLYQAPDSVVWIGTATGLLRMDPTGQLREYNTQNSKLSHNTIRSIRSDGYGNLWVGTYDKLNKLDQHRNRFTVFDLKGNYKSTLKNNLICDIKPSSLSDSLLWIGTETGLVSFNVFTGRHESFDERNVSLSNEVIKNIYEDDKGKLWLGTDFGLNVFDPVQGNSQPFFHNPQLPYSIANNVIWQIMEDNGGVVWFVTSNGLSRLNKFTNYYSYNEVSYQHEGKTIGNQVKSVLTAANGDLWLGTLHGVIHVNSLTGEREIFDTYSAENRRIILNNVYALEEDDHGRIWIGTAGGINVWEPSRSRMHSITSGPTNGLITNYIAKFTKGADGSFWVSAWEGGLFRVTGNFQDIASIRFELAGDFGSEKNVSGSNAIWAIHYDELFRIDLGSHRSTRVGAFNQYSAKHGITCLYFSRKGSLWAGTVNGLIEYRPPADTAVFHPVITGNDLTLASLTEDHNGNIWAATNGLVLKFDIHNQNTEFFPLDKDVPIKSFFDGCSAVTPGGELIFGGDNGYIKLSPTITPKPFEPGIYVTSLEINNKKINIGDDGEITLDRDIAFSKDLVLNYNQRSVAFEFASLHYWQPSMNVYAYQLEGLESRWTYVSGARNFAVYSNLAPGDYIFKVRATNNYGIWSNKTTSVALHVNPPVFLSQGFITLYAVAGIALIIILLRFYTSRLHWRNEARIARLEKSHAEELALTKQQFFTNISHELRTPISLILPPIQQTLKRENLDEESRAMLRLAEKNSQRLLRVVNQILDFRKLEHDSLEIRITSFDIVAFCRDLHSLFSDKAARNEIHFTFQSSVNKCRLWADMDKIETILYNLLSNAFKFTPPGGSIDITVKAYGGDLEFSKEAVQVLISDTGIGIPADDLPRIFERFYQSNDGKKMDAGSGIGLTLAQEYTKLHHGRLTVKSEAGKGSQFSLVLPISNEHFPLDADNETEAVNLLATRADDESPDKPYLYDLDSDKPLVLLVEDNADMVDFLRIHLKDSYHVIVATHGEEGLKKASRFLPEVIISDIMMPVMDGLDLCRNIKANPKTSHIGIILLTAKGLTSQKIEGIRLGADVYITKPFEVELLQASVGHLLKRKKELADYFKSALISPAPLGVRESVDEKFVKKVMNIIEARIGDPAFSVEALSDEIGMSATHLYRKLKSLTNLSANEIIKKYRIKKASLLLQNKEGNISEIMYEVGFSNLSYFSKCFKAEFGITPKEFQNSTGRKTVDVGAGPAA